MKNKGLTYALLIVVAFVWYKVFVRVASNFTGEDTALVQPNDRKTAFRSIERDTFSLNASYRDPFTGSSGSLQPVTDQVPPTTSKPEAKVVKKTTVDWPTIRYKGLIRKTNSSNPLAIIYIDGNQLYMRKGESIYDGIVLKTIHRDSVIISYKKGKRTFYRE